MSLITILKRVSLILLLICFFTNGSKLTAQSNSTISGKINVPETIKKSRRKNTGYNHKHSSRLKKTSTIETENVVVFLEEIGKKNTYKYNGSNPILSQNDAEFVPKVLPILKGTTVDIRNEDKIYHNVFSLSETKPFNIGRRPKGENVPQKFESPGIVRVFCDIHSNMSAYIVVLENPFYAVGTKEGDYKILNVPPGRYKISAWHNSYDTITKEISVLKNENQTINFDLK